MIETSASLAHNVALSSMTTLAVGGPATTVALPLNEDETIDVVRATQAAGVPLHVIGGGSNVLIADTGLPGVVLKSSDFGFSVRRADGHAYITAAAGVIWDDVVEFAVAEKLTGIETLSGIPGLVGAAPIQNIGAYGTELSEAVVSVRAIDRETGAVREFSAEECGFSYRNSAFKSAWRDMFVITSVTIRVTPDAPAQIRYPELAAMLGVKPGGTPPPLETVRAVVLKIRKKKSMVYNTADPNHRSAGSFFTNPIVDAATADAVAEVVVPGRPANASAMPRWDVDGGVKLSAAWLIENAGFSKGFAFGQAGLSSKHTLALINRGRAKASDLVSLAAVIRRGVRGTFGVALTPEPNFMGFDRSVEELLG